MDSNAGGTNDNFVREICGILQNRKCIILVFGNKQFQERLKYEFNIEGMFGISDKSLAKIYSRSKLTICPQKWETFGYVLAESISCGTPVLAFNVMGSAEIVRDTQMGILANNEKEFLRKIEDFNFEKRKEDDEKKSYPWDLDYSTKKLNDAISDSQR